MAAGEEADLPIQIAHCGRIAAERFPQDVVELQALFAADPRLTVQATPGAGAQVELWMLGSSLFGAGLAAQLGLPYVFASHFARESAV